MRGGEKGKCLVDAFHQLPHESLGVTVVSALILIVSPRLRSYNQTNRRSATEEGCCAP